MTSPTFRGACSICLFFSLTTAPLRAAIHGAENPKAYTANQYHRDLLDFNRRTLTDQYQQVGNHDPKWDAQAAAFLNGMAIRFSNVGVTHRDRLPDEPSFEELDKQAKALRDLGCDDPLILDMCSVMMLDSGQRKEYRAWRERRLMRCSPAGIRSAAPPTAPGERCAIRTRPTRRINTRDSMTTCTTETWPRSAAATCRAMIGDLCFTRCATSWIAGPLKSSAASTKRPSPAIPGWRTWSAASITSAPPGRPAAAAGRTLSRRRGGRFSKRKFKRRTSVWKMPGTSRPTSRNPPSR